MSGTAKDLIKAIVREAPASQAKHRSNGWFAAHRFHHPRAQMGRKQAPIQSPLVRPGKLPRASSHLHIPSLARSNARQNTASCVVAKLIRISVLGRRSAWNSAPGASR